MRCFFGQRIPQKPTVCDIQTNLLCCSAQRWYSVYVLNYCRFEQYDWVCTGSAIVRTVQLFYYVVDFREIYRLVYFPQKMILWYQVVYVNYFSLSSFFSFLAQHFHHPTLLYHIYVKKPPFTNDARWLFRQTEPQVF